ncbi:MAG TPA: hypothetical protein V6C52_07310 [Coleofasciculaceae cyanobacterium]|jgi:hypothetical protein
MQNTNTHPDPANQLPIDQKILGSYSPGPYEVQLQNNHVQLNDRKNRVAIVIWEKPVSEKTLGILHKRDPEAISNTTKALGLGIDMGNLNAPSEAHDAMQERQTSIEELPNGKSYLLFSYKTYQDQFHVYLPCILGMLPMEDKAIILTACAGEYATPDAEASFNNAYIYLSSLIREVVINSELDDRLQ